MSNEIKIGNDIFVVCPLLGERSFLLQPLILPVLAELSALFALYGRSKNGESTAEDVLEQAGPIVARACGKLQPELLKEIMRALLEGATMNGQMLYTQAGNPIDVLMRGRTMDIWRLLGHSLKVSYPDFFGGISGLLAKRREEGNSATSATSAPGPVGGLS